MKGEGIRQTLYPRVIEKIFERLEQEAYGVSSEAMLGTTSVGRSPRLLRPPDPMRETRVLVGREVLTTEDTGWDVVSYVCKFLQVTSTPLKRGWLIFHDL